MEQMIQIRCKNNKKTKNIRIGSTLSEVYDEFGLEMDYGPVSAKVNNRVEGMHYRVYNSKDVEFLSLKCTSGWRAYVRSLFFVLCKAVHDLYPDGKVYIDIPVSNGYYCDLNIGRYITYDDVDRLRARMQEIIDMALPIHRHESTTEEAIEIFRKLGSESKVKLLESTGSLYTTYYEIDGYHDNYYGTVLTNTAYLHLFGLEKYFDGLLLRIPSKQLVSFDSSFKLFFLFFSHPYVLYAYLLY